MKKDTGMSRKVDELGRIVIPKEIRNKFDIKTKDRMDIYVENSKKCIFCSSTKDLIDHNNKHVCNKCMQKLVKKFMIV